MLTVILEKTFDSDLLKANWNKLLENYNVRNIHLTYEWLHSWWNHYGDSRQLLILSVKDGQSILGIAPLMMTTQKILPGINIKRIEFIGTGISDYHDFIINERQDEVINAIFEFLSHFGWHIIKLRHIPENSGNLTFIRKYFSENTNLTWHVYDKPVVECPYIPLKQVGEKFFNNLSKNLRYDLKRKLRKLGETGDVRFKCINGKNGEINQCFESIFSIHRKNWNQRKERCAFSFEIEQNKIFFKDITEILNKNDKVRLFGLFLDDRLIAYIYCFLYNNVIYHWNTSFDTEYFRFSVGKLLHRFAIEESIRAGYDEFNFMRGDEEYKKKWTNQSRKNVEITILNETITSNITGYYYLKIKPYLENNKTVQHLLSNKYLNKMLG